MLSYAIQLFFFEYWLEHWLCWQYLQANNEIDHAWDSSVGDGLSQRY
tara:strand:- start:371 stop:511 length:141 start_codon:yes stop_codon:yes gene_type:complete